MFEIVTIYADGSRQHLFRSTLNEARSIAREEIKLAEVVKVRIVFSTETLFPPDTRSQSI